MNFFFLIKNNFINSYLKIPIFQNSGIINKNLKLFSAKPLLNKWKLEKLNIKPINDFFFIDSKDFSDEVIFFLAQDEDLKNYSNLNSKFFETFKFTDTSPAYRANLSIDYKKNGFSSYQSEYPFHMIKNKGSVLTPLSALLSKDADENYLLFKNINISPKQEIFNIYIIDIENFEIIKKIACKTNSTNVVKVDFELINENYFFYSNEYLGLPIYVSIKNKHLSLEHTQPPQLYFLNQTKILLKDLKSKIYDKNF